LLYFHQITIRNKGKERKGRVFYIAPFRTKVHTKRSGMDHTVLPANNTMHGHSDQWTITSSKQQH